MASSGTTSFAPSVADFVLDAYERCDTPSPSLKVEHMQSANRSTNFVLVRMALRGVNLWKVDPIATPTLINLVQGVATYPLPSDIVGMLDTYCRVQFTPLIGGSTTNPNPATNATFATAAASGTVSVNQTDHGFVATELITLNEPVLVGGLTLYGQYTIATVLDDDNFTFSAGTNASSTASVTVPGTTGSDVIMLPISRTDFAGLPNKSDQGKPTTYCFSRQANPSFTVWPTPDGNGPYQIAVYLLHQVQDAYTSGAQTPDLPYRADFAFVSMLAADLSIKWKPEKYQMLEGIAKEAWPEFADDDREKVSLYVTPDMTGYLTG